jgi:hypothetical protein
MRLMPIVVFVVVAALTSAAEEPIRFEHNKLVYVADAQGNVIPDFSNCGYGGGGVELPIVPVKETVEAPSGDAGAAIQAAIDKVSALPLDANGLRGAVLLKKGTYSIAGTLHIKASGVVLRGEGEGEKETL